MVLKRVMDDVYELACERQLLRHEWCGVGGVDMLWTIMLMSL